MDASTCLSSLNSRPPSSQSPTRSKSAEKPQSLAHPHFDRTCSDAPSAITSADVNDSPSQMSRIPLVGHPSFQRVKKRVVTKRNKACIIALPLESESGHNKSGQGHLKAAEVAERLKEWEDKGFDTRGFVLGLNITKVYPFLYQGQSRAVYPDPEEEDRERSQRSYRVSIPDRREWEVYVNQLKEQKLRALGVSFGGEDLPLRKSSAPSLMSRQASSQSSAMLLSPPLHASSMPPNQLGPTYQLSANQPVKHGVSHFPRYSVAMPFGDKAFQHSSQYPRSQSPVHRNLSPLGYLSSQSGSRLGSPSINEQIVGSHASLSPGPPSAQSLRLFSTQDPPELSAHMRQQQSLLQTKHLQQQQPLPYHHYQQHQRQVNEPPRQVDVRTPHYSHDNLVPAHNHLHANIITPTPQGHRQNPSESLQREVEEAEAYLEEAEKEKEGFETARINGKTEASINQGAAEPVHPTEAENDRLEMNDIKDGTLQLGTSTQTPNLGGGPSKHGSKSSISSKLNVDAPEFKFEPKTAIEAPAPDAFSFLGKPQTSPSLQGIVTLPSSDIVYAYKAPHPRLSPKFNVRAPVFMPGATAAPKPSLPSRVFSFGVGPASNTEINSETSAPPREFSFSSKTHDLNPDAPPFKPGEPVNAASSARVDENSVEQVKKIFGDLNFSEVIKPANRSKALTIVNPEEERSRCDEASDGPEDESGRITQSDARQKRMRRDRDSGDQVPQFATPTDTGLLGNCVDMRAVPIRNTQSSSTSEAAPTTLEAATDLLEEIIDHMSASEASSLLRENPTKTNGAAAEASTFHDAEQAATFNAARPPLLSQEHSIDQTDPTAEEVTEATKAFLRKSSQFTTEFDHEVQRRMSCSRSSSDPLSDDDRGKFLIDNRMHRVDYARQKAPLRQDVLDGVRYVEPSNHEIEAVMKHLNQEGDSDIGIDRNRSPWRRPSLASRLAPNPRQELHEADPYRLLPPADIKSDAPSHSPNRLREPFQYLPPTDTESADSAAVRIVAQNARYSPSYRPSKKSPPIHRLNSPGSTPPSDWNDAISSIDEAQFNSRTGFFNSRVNDVLGNIVQQRLGPLEKRLLGIHESLAHLSKRTVSRATSRRPRSSGIVEILNSDADDEDEIVDVSQSRLKSPLRDRKYDQLKVSISEIAAAQQSFATIRQLEEVLDAIKDLKMTVSQAPHTSNPASDIKHIVEEAVNRQMRGKSAPVISSSQAAAAEKSNLHIAGLESMLKIAETRAEDEMKARRATEDALADNQRLLRQALHEAAQQRESAEATERSLEEYHEERQHNLKRTAMLEGSQESLEKKASEMCEKNEALESTLAEYRLSHEQWRADIDDARHRNKDLCRDIQSLKTELEDSAKHQHDMQLKYDHLRESIASASRDLADDQSQWRSKEEEHKNKLDLLSTRLEAEARTRERLELEIERLELQEKEAMKARFQVEQTQKANAHLDKLISQLRSESHEHENAAARLQRELHAAKETGIMEVHRTRSAMESDIKAAKSEVNVVRAELEDTIARMEKRLEDTTGDAERLGSQHKLILEEASESRNAALREAADAREKELRDHYNFHERTLEEVKKEHQRAIQIALEDKQRSEISFVNHISLAEEKLRHLQDKIALLEGKLEIANSAAQAAVQAAQANKTSPSPSATPSVVTKAPGIPEKISPQALRESIIVLQEQLQARESHIEEMEGDLAALDMDAPVRLKDANIEITWLRELLSVRMDDLQDIIATLSRPSFDREAIKDAAIRLKANLQMEQQEKERTLIGGQASHSLSNISNLAASPKALPLAAAAAWGNWRKRRESGFSNLSAIANRSANQTPSKSSSSPQSFFAGLMTPPSTSMRNTLPLQHGARSIPASSSLSTNPLRSPSMRGQSIYFHDEHGDREERQHKQPQQDPVTPPLMRKASYDLDAAEATIFGDGGKEQYRKSDDEVREDEEPFGPRIGTFAAK